MTSFASIWWMLSIAGRISCAAFAVSEPVAVSRVACQAHTVYPQDARIAEIRRVAARSREAIAAESQLEAEALVATDDAPLFDSRCSIYDGLYNQPLLDAVYDEVSGHTVLGYRNARDHMYGLREPVIDIFDGRIECVYTGRLAVPDGTRTPEGMNTEHTWPQSKGSREEPARSDIHHLFITDEKVNSRRQNYEYGNTRCNDPGAVECRWEGPDHSESPSQLGFDERGEPVFEVRSERRGDIARSQFYFAARYNMPIGPHTEKVLRTWHEEDPPDARENERNRRIELVQGNRNPFVDCPDIVERIADF